MATITYLAAPNSENALDWINALKPLCVSQLTRAPKVARLRELRSLHLHILDAHRLPYKLVPNPFIIVALNNVKVARTKVKTGLHTIWDEEFILEYVYDRSFYALSIFIDKPLVLIVNYLGMYHRMLCRFR